MLNTYIASVSFEEYTLLQKLGEKFETIPNHTVYQSTTQYALEIFSDICLQRFTEGWEFWFTDHTNTIPALSITHPPLFQFSPENKWSRLTLGTFHEYEAVHILISLNFLARAAELINSGYRLRRIQGKDIVDATEELGLHVFVKKPHLRLLTKKK